MADAVMDATLADVPMVDAHLANAPTNDTPPPTFDGICAVAGDNSAGRPLLEAILAEEASAEARLGCKSGGVKADFRFCDGSYRAQNIFLKKAFPKMFYSA
mgnify:CR=1 FL=1